ncbi:hypothetical protein MKC91_05610 [[Clostridium] innocuum]|nr:hypothetical protein [Erysipelotrichaceae bacterium]MCR0381079.1 hypothetical protein [[Clostridium] innocuum]MCR0412345.1 hypothetical protein [[Clostridium] innocuum]MCR0533788.1 hypothetical protein [[Clostridium] innocuum]MCR0537873.1 hypothetical protein [[Clostridium] innocuum]
MKKKAIIAALLTLGLAAGVGTQIHAQDTAYLCGGNHSHMHMAADDCLRTLQEQKAARDAAAKRQAEAAQRQAQATQRQNAVVTPASNSTVQAAVKTETAENTAYTGGTQQPDSVQPVATAQQSTNTAIAPCPYHENCDGTHQHNANCDGNHLHNESCNNGMQGNHHSERHNQGAHHGSGSGHHRR